MGTTAGHGTEASKNSPKFNSNHHSLPCSWNILLLEMTAAWIFLFFWEKGKQMGEFLNHKFIFPFLPTEK